MNLRTRAIAATCALTLGTSCIPGVAFAQPAPGIDDEPLTAVSQANNATEQESADAASASGEGSAGAASETAVDKADFYAVAADDAASPAEAAAASPDADGIELLDAPNPNATVTPRTLSSELMYFGQYESGNYNQGFSYGDNYHALGYYQFDNRYGLQNFMIACYNYDPETYHMLSWLKYDGVNISQELMYDKDAGKLTEIGQRVEDSWHAAYAASPSGFARLQDGWQYSTYIKPALDYLNGRGLNMDSRRDCVKGLVGGIMGLFGSGGWRQFVGGYFNGKTYEGAGLTGDMSDRAFVTALCNYIVDHVAEFYPGQPQYHQGWQNRYKNELKTCLGYLGAYPDDVSASDWYVKSGAYDYVTSKGLINGYTNGLFGPNDNVTRGQLATILWRLAGKPQASASNFNDVDYSLYYGDAIRWARAKGVIGGYGTTNTFKPDASVTREELAVMLANYAKTIDGHNLESDGADLAARSDANKVSNWALDQMEWVVEKGIIQEVGSTGQVQPQATATRAMAAEMMLRYSRVKKGSKSEYVLYDSDSRYYTRAELEALSDWELKVAHNEIYARYGKGFRSADLAAHFKNCSWYTELYSPDQFDSMNIPLNAYEQANANLMAQIRAERG